MWQHEIQVNTGVEQKQNQIKRNTGSNTKTIVKIKIVLVKINGKKTLIQGTNKSATEF